MSKIGAKCQNWQIQMRHFGRFSNTVKYTLLWNYGLVKLSKISKSYVMIIVWRWEIVWIMKVSPLKVEQCEGKVEQKTFPNLIFDYFYLVCFGCCFSDRCCSTASKSTEVSSLLLDPTVATAGFTASLQVFSFSAEAPTSIVNANQGRQKSSCLYILSLSLPLKEMPFHS